MTTPAIPPPRPLGRGKGHIPDDDPPPSQFGSFMSATRGAAAPIDMMTLKRKLRDQSISNGCVGFAFARALDLRAQIEGIPNPYPSALTIWTMARLIGGARTLTNVGCMPADAGVALKTVGIVDEKRWPFDEGKMNDHLPWDVIQHAADAQVSGVFRIDAFGADRVDQIRTMLERGYPVAFGMNVDKAYEDWHGGEPYNGPRGPSLGGHMQVLVYDKSLKGLPQLRDLGSWEDWGEDDGTSRLTDEFVGSSYVTDVYAITIAPPGVC